MQVDPWREGLDTISGRLRRVITDNRMHAWEWLRLPEGRWLKADARVCLEFPNDIQVIKCSESYR